MWSKFLSLLRRFFTTNILLKVIAVLLGFVFWVLLSNIQDPTVSRTLNIPVNYTNADVLKDDGLIFLSGPETVAVRVYSKRSDQNRLDAGMFRCTADLVNHTGGDVSSQMVHISVIQVGGSDLVIDWEYLRNDPNIIVKMDRYITKTFPIQVVYEDSLSEGLVLADSLTLSPSSITVSGPESAFGSLSDVKTVVNMRELSEIGSGTVSAVLPLTLYDSAGKTVTNTSELILESAVTTLTATIYRLKTVQVILSGVTGSPASGYRFVNTVLSNNILAVSGLKSRVADLSVIYIPETVVDISGISETTDYEINASRYLPEGVTLAEGSGIVKVTVNVEPLDSERFNVPTDRIRITGQKEGYTYEIRTSSVTVIVSGLQDDLEIFSPDILEMSVDVSGLEDGLQNTEVRIGDAPGYFIENQDAVRVYIYCAPAAAPTEEQGE
ncbi:MAG: hypothetical protein J6Z23_04025 [Lachnospiraceae bacterium]|nr:hypothetical protein [Lachnospiraceae bacterium]